MRAHCVLRAWISAACRVVFDQDYQILKLSRSSVLVSMTSTLRFRRRNSAVKANQRVKTMLEPQSEAIWWLRVLMIVLLISQTCWWRVHSEQPCWHPGRKMQEAHVMPLSRLPVLFKHQRLLESKDPEAETFGDRCLKAVLQWFFPAEGLLTETSHFRQR